MDGMRALDRIQQRQSARAEVKIWDGLVRVFHWSTALLVAALVVTAHLGMQDVHMTLGIDLGVLFLARLLWGFMETGHARFSTFVRGPTATLGYLRDIVRGHPHRHIGHNPAGAAMVVALLATLGGLLVTGVLLQATFEFEGPLVDALRWVDDASVHRLMMIHGSLVNALYVLVPLHLLGVALASVQHRENLVRAMITGYKSTNTNER